MQRLLLTVAAREQGWQLYEGDQGRQFFEDREEALHTAALIAATLHQRHGIRSGVVMDMTGCEAVLVSRHG
ncbi:hypothetical protein [Pseudoxanthomonas sp. USHLN014]|uniref:hypothetical protein n=1 Tax=Pseudoxanthomonas sp. USHLN014 TaxID=3081297 RepID=UPI00301D9FED